MSLTFENAQTRELARRIHELSRDLTLIEQLRAPSVRDIAAAPLIEGWAVGVRAEPALIGIVRGHQSLPDGPVVTSPLYYLDPVARYARTLSRWYQLGDPMSSN